MAEAGGVSVPDYDELPLHEALGMRHAWGVFGDADELGTLNHMGPAERVAAREEIREGRTFNLSLPLDLPKPAMFGRRGYTHHVFSSARNIQDDSLDSFYPQASSQWDALRHVRAREFGFYNGVPEEEAGAEGERLGIDRFAEYGVVGRAALLDVARYLEAQGRAVDPGGTYRIRVEDPGGGAAVVGGGGTAGGRVADPDGVAGGVPGVEPGGAGGDRGAVAVPGAARGGGDGAVPVEPADQRGGRGQSGGGVGAGGPGGWVVAPAADPDAGDGNGGDVEPGGAGRPQRGGRTVYGVLGVGTAEPAARGWVAGERGVSQVKGGR